MDLQAPAGSFTHASLFYNEARSLYDERVIKQIMNVVEPNSSILDIGCGTGIATRQLFEAHKVPLIGADIDGSMIEQAQARTPNQLIQYFVAPTNTLPFSDQAFDIVTCFAAFHWFTDAASMREIKRVMKPGAYFFIINKNEASSFKQDLREIIGRLVNREIKDPKAAYDPARQLSVEGFQQVTTQTFSKDESFLSIEEALVFVKSLNVWSFVPADREKEISEKVMSYLSTLYKEGVIPHLINYVTVRGTK